MPPRYAYWTIIADGLPTAFRAAQKDELQPTFSQIKLKHPDAEMKWFARGRLWDSPESARAANQRAHQASSQPTAPPRGREWRPGGEHRDPRQKFKDAKQARNTAQRKRKFERRQRFADGGADRVRRPHGGGQRRFDRQPFEKRVQQRPGPRNQRTDEPKPTPPDRPNREPRRREGDEPTPPPRPSEPITTPPGPPERGRRRGQERHPRRRR